MPGRDTHQAQDLGGLSSQDLECLIDRLDEQDEFNEVVIVSGLSFDLFPKILDRIVVWRVRRQLVDGEAFFMLFQEFTSGFAGVVASTVLDEDHPARDLRKQVAQKGWVAVRLKALFGSLVDQATREEFDAPKTL